jgi:hypothetical protein
MTDSNLSLKELALLTWKNERSKKEASRLELKAKYLQSIRRKLTEMFGQVYEINTSINEDEVVIATVDNMRFSTFIYNEEVITIIPVVKCPSCGKDAFLGAVNDLAELGEVLEEFELGLRHTCR